MDRTLSKDFENNKRKEMPKVLYKLKCTGKEINSSFQMAELKQEEVEELFQTPVSQWEYLELRKMFHDLGNSQQRVLDLVGEMVDEVNDNIKKLSKKIEYDNLIKVGNGGDKLVERDLKSVVIEMHEMLRKDRKKKRAKTVLRENSVYIFLFMTILLLFSYFFHEDVSVFFEWLKGKEPIVIGSLFLPLILMYFKKLFFNKKES